MRIWTAKKTSTCNCRAPRCGYKLGFSFIFLILRNYLDLLWHFGQCYSFVKSICWYLLTLKMYLDVSSPNIQCSPHSQLLKEIQLEYVCGLSSGVWETGNGGEMRWDYVHVAHCFHYFSWSLLCSISNSWVASVRHLKLETTFKLNP